MTVLLTTKGHTYHFVDADEMIIEVDPDEGIVFNADREDGVQVYRVKEEHNEQRDNGTGQS